MLLLCLSVSLELGILVVCQHKGTTISCQSLYDAYDI